MPHYTLEDFTSTCKKDPARVLLWLGVLPIARAELSLRNKAAVTDFLGNDGLEMPVHLNSRPLRAIKSPQLIIVDSYEFRSGLTKGYLAFFQSPKTGCWVVKSLKRSDRSAAEKLGYSPPYQAPMLPRSFHRGEERT